MNFPSLTPAELRNKWRSLVDSVFHISVWTTPEELSWLAEVASQCQYVAEVGSYKGKSGKVLAGACRGIVLCADCFVDNTRPDFERNLQKELASRKVLLLPLDSAAAAQTLKAEAKDWNFDMIFIDDGHAESDVDRDIAEWLPLVRPGGILCGHDFEKDDPNSGVAKSVRKNLPGFSLVAGTIWAWKKPE